MNAAAWEAARRILCVRLDAMGDVLMTTPAITALRRPDRTLTLLTSPAGAGVGALVPAIHKVMIYEAPWVKATAPRADSGPDLDMIQRLRAGRFDGAVIFTVYSQNPLPAALLCYLADIPLRLAHARENPYQLLTDWIPETEPEQGIRHEVRRQLDLVSHIGCRTADERLQLRVPAAAGQRVVALLARAGIARGQPWAVVHPGASAPSRRWPASRFAEVVQRLVRIHGWQIVLTGSSDERPLLEAVREAARVPAPVFSGLELPELAALIARSRLLISNNTGPVHVAAAVGTAVVDLYALTNPQHTPWQVPARVLFQDVPCRCCYKSVCPQGHHRCLTGVTVDDVVNAALDLSRPQRPLQPERSGTLAGAP